MVTVHRVPDGDTDPADRRRHHRDRGDWDLTWPKIALAAGLCLLITTCMALITLSLIFIVDTQRNLEKDLNTICEATVQAAHLHPDKCAQTYGIFAPNPSPSP